MSRFFCLILSGIVLVFLPQNIFSQDTLLSDSKNVITIQTEQDSILLMNGKYRHGFVDSVGFEKLYYSFNKKANLSKVFSFSKDGKNVIQYRDRSIDYLSQAQMRTLIAGKQIGLKKYDNRAIIVSAFALSFTASIFDTYESIDNPAQNPNFTSPQFSGDRFFAREPTFGQFVVPLTFTFSINAFKPKLKSKHLSNQSYLENELIIEGFQTTAKRKKFYGAMFSGLAGTASGLLSYLVFKK